MSTSQHRIEGRVAAILNARELVINIGEAHGVAPDMKFAVLAATPLSIKDPASGKILDTIDREKIRVQAAEVRQLITICRTYRTKIINPGGLSDIDITHLLPRFSTRKEVQETLATPDAQLPPPLSEDESFVKVNDRVKQVAEDED